MRKVLIFTSLLLIKNICAFGQRSVAINEKTYEARAAIGLIGGLSGFQTSDFEIGLGLNFIETRPENEKFTKPFLGFSLSANLNPTNKDLIGQNLSAWLNSLIVPGVSEHYYKYNDLNTITMKPFVGLEIYGLTFTYGRNIFLTSNKISELSKNVFSVRYFLYLKKFSKNGT